jgi:uncharacterized protein
MSQTATQSKQCCAPATPPTGSFCWYEVSTREVDKVKKFYGELCGWTTSPSAMGIYHHWHDRDGVMFGGIMDMNSDEWKGVPAHWMTYVRVDDTNAKAAKVTAMGGNVCVPPTDIPTVGRFSVVNDPTGGTFSLISLLDPKPISRVMAWTELMTRDAPKAKEFYRNLLGWGFDSMPMGGEADYTICKNGDDMIGGIMQMDGPQFEGVPPHWLNYIATAQVDADAAKLVELGGKMLVPPFDIPNNIGRCCVFTDPGGASIALHQPGSMD